jgi:hypothetical protein
MKQRTEQILLLGIAAVSGAAALGLDAIVVGMILAVLNLALAVCAGSR